MTADLLHRAATLIRQRAQAASPSPWVVAEHHVFGRPGDGKGSPISVANTGWGDRSMSESNADHIAGMSPAVALAVADWLEAEASSHLHVGEDEIARSVYDMPGMHNSPAMRVARAYLGEDA